MSHRKWRETKQQPSRAKSCRQLSCCLVCLHFLCNILTSHPLLHSHSSLLSHPFLLMSDWPLHKITLPALSSSSGEQVIHVQASKRLLWRLRECKKIVKLNCCCPKEPQSHLSACWILKVLFICSGGSPRKSVGLRNLNGGGTRGNNRTAVSIRYRIKHSVLS